MHNQLENYLNELRKLEKPENLSALALFSGGLDSLLAAHIIAELGIKVTALHFDTGFLTGNHRAKVENWRKVYPEIDFEYIDISDEFIDLLNNPKYGYGAGLNPCIDCHLFMLRKSAELLVKKQAHFIVTGEVKGQRPKSQNSRAMKEIEEQSYIEGFLLRPLSAKILPETIPEQKGWVKREKFFAINGRSREQQLQLVKEFNLKFEANPGSDACNLLESAFSVKYFDFLLHNKNIKPTKQDFEIFKLGRHFRINLNIKLIVGRNKFENEKLLKLRGNKYLLDVLKVKSPLGLLEFNEKPDLDDFSTAAQIIASYCDAQENSTVSVCFSRENEDDFIIPVQVRKEHYFFDYKLVGVSKSRKKTEKVPYATSIAKKYKGEINKTF